MEGELRLGSLVYRAVWFPGREAVARCRRPFAAFPWQRMPLHGAPDWDCVCGIYAVKTAALAIPYLTCSFMREGNDGPRVIGCVSLWGKVVESQWGWRSTFAYPARLFVPGTRRRRLSLASSLSGQEPAEVALALAGYGVPVEVLDSTARGDPLLSSLV